METYGDRLLILMKLVGIKNPAKLADIIEEKSSESTLYKICGNRNDGNVPKRIDDKLAAIGANIHWLTIGKGPQLCIDAEIEQNIRALQEKHPGLYRGIDFKQYDPDKKNKPVDELSDDEFIGALVRWLARASNAQRKVTAEVVNRFAAKQ